MLYLLKNTWKYAGKEKWKLAVCYVLHTISAGGDLIQPYAFGMAMNTLQLHGISNLKNVLPWAGLYVLGFAIFQIFHRSGRYFEISTAVGNQKRFIEKIYRKLYELPLKWHVDNHSGEIVSRVKSAGEALESFGCSQCNFIQRLILSAGPIIILAGIDYRLTLISLILLAVNLTIVFMMNKNIWKILERKSEGYHKFSGRLADFISNIRTVVTLRLGGQTRKEINKKFEPVYKEIMHENSVNQVRCFILDLGAIIIELSVIVIYIWSVQQSGEVFLIGNLVMIITYFRNMRDAIFEIASSFYEVMRWKVAVKSADVILKVSEHKENNREYSSNQIPWCKLILNSIEHTYDGDRFCLAVENFSISKGQNVAVIGSSGAGKSTMLHVMAGLYEADKFDIEIDGTKYQTAMKLSESICLVSQEIELFENTILYNITFGMEADTLEVNRALEISGFADVIKRLPSGLHTDIREKGVNLSGGEKQRLALARGLYFARSRSMLLLDEITGSVDAEIEKAIMRKLLSSYRDKCIMCSVHRLHLLDMFDTVIVMKEGRIVQNGTFKELSGANGQFKILWDEYQLEKAE